MLREPSPAAPRTRAGRATLPSASAPSSSWRGPGAAWTSSRSPCSSEAVCAAPSSSPPLSSVSLQRGRRPSARPCAPARRCGAGSYRTRTPSPRSGGAHAQRGRQTPLRFAALTRNQHALHTELGQTLMTTGTVTRTGSRARSVVSPEKGSPERRENSWFPCALTTQSCRGAQRSVPTSCRGDAVRAAQGRRASASRGCTGTLAWRGRRTPHAQTHALTALKTCTVPGLVTTDRRRGKPCP